GPELRAAVGPLRSSGSQRPSDVESLADGEGQAVAPPAPRLADVPQLLGAARAAGLATSVRVEPGTDPLPQPVELTAFRIVQESVTNVVRHARAARVDVAVIREGDTLVVDVRDDGAPPTNAGGGAGGLGVIGMRERAQLLGGSVEVGPAMGD